jgi:hypothetical protein
MAGKYSETDIARLAGQDYKSLTGYEQRLVRGYNRGLSRSESRGHARTQKGETPVSKRVDRPKIEKGTGKVSPPAPGRQPKPVLPKSQRRKISRPHVQNMYRKSDTGKKNPVGKAVNARNETTLEKQISRLPNNSGVLFHIINTRTGEEIRAVGSGKGSTVNAGDFKQAIASELASGKSYKDALRAALSNLFIFYGVDPLTGIRTSEELDSIPDDVSNFIMYTIY